ncbi:MAG: V-type ATP synthase subunit E family protein [Gammaproteobacteria bacterium]|nr:V-type ATP synthase subunit E family protein [Gammaproteobacteria bacterium]
MNEATSVDELKQAILTKAHDIAAEYHERAEQARDNILLEARERLHLREEHETKIGKIIADREYARLIQANELKLHRKLDMLRWSLVEGVMKAVKDRFIRAIENDPEGYIKVLGAWTQEACKLLPYDKLVAELNSRDHQLLKDHWDEFTRQYVPESVHLKISQTDCETLGGIRITTPDNLVRIDNCYEGRMQRLEAQIQQSIMQKLFSTVEQLQQIIHK